MTSQENCRDPDGMQNTWTCNTVLNTWACNTVLNTWACNTVLNYF